ncbi:monooxygenase [Actinomycetes bacterium KLBMP 9797]
MNHQHPPAPPRIAVVGGSLTGPMAALLLLRAGFDHVAVYDAAPGGAPRHGGLIGLADPALDVLDRLGIGQEEFVAFGSQYAVQMSVRERAVTGTLAQVYPGRHTTWTLLHHALATRLPRHVIHSGRRVTGIGEAGDGPVLRFTRGRRRGFDVVVFADGRASTGRRLLDPGRRLRYAGYVAHRGTAPLRHGGVREFTSVQPCPGVLLNLAPVPGPGIDWSLYLNTTADQYASWFGARPDERLFVLPEHVSALAYAHVDANADTWLPAAQANLVHATAARTAVPVMDIDPPRRMVWPVGAGFAVLVGDALAPVRPHTARGLNNGIEQVADLVAVLRQHRRYGADLAAGLDGWQRRHLPVVHADLALGPRIAGRLGLGARPDRIVELV